MNAEFSSDNLTINSKTIEVIKDKNEILFNGNVFIKSKNFIVNADKALYNNLNKIVYVNGTPSRIESIDDDNMIEADKNRKSWITEISKVRPNE